MAEQDVTTDLNADSGEFDAVTGDVTGVHGDLGAVEAIAAVTLAPVTELQHSPWLLRAAIACQLASTLVIGLIAWRLSLPDLYAFIAISVATNVLVGNSMRWRRRWGWLRRIVLTSVAEIVTLSWAILLTDRAQAGTRNLTRDEAASPWFWIPAALLTVSAVLMILHLVIATRRDHLRLQQIRGN